MFKLLDFRTKRGQYFCQRGGTFLLTSEKPDPPVLQFPEDTFEGDVIWIITTWDAGNPLVGHIVHDIVRGFKGESALCENL